MIVVEVEEKLCLKPVPVDAGAFFHVLKEEHMHNVHLQLAVSMTASSDPILMLVLELVLLAQQRSIVMERF